MKTSNLKRLFTKRFWHDFFKNRPGYSLSFNKPMRVAMASMRGFSDDDCSSKASSLTFYSLLAIVPVLAVAFGIAKGFGLEKHLQNELIQHFSDQIEIVNTVIDFAHNLLQNTQSGLIAGVGVVVLFWTVLKLLGNIETSFNAIWKVKSGRPLQRQLSDYLAMMLFCPLFFAVSSSFSVFVIAELTSLTKSSGIWEPISPLLLLLFHLFPLVLSIMLFTATYYVMPNTKVSLSCAVTAGAIAGSIYQVVQWTYIQFQIGVASYGAIYGSFAALPLFLLWLNISWLITLAGAEVAYQLENEITIGPLAIATRRYRTNEEVVSLLVVNQCVNAFNKGTLPPTIFELTQAIGVPSVPMRHLLHKLTDAGILTEVTWKDGTSGHFQPARALNSITYKSICDALDTARQPDYLIHYSKEAEHYVKILSEIDSFLVHSPLNYTFENDSFETKALVVKEN